MADSTTPNGINTELWEFPCTIAFKAMASNRENIEIDVISVIQEVIPGDYVPNVKPSAKGNYVSITVTVTLEHEHQVETLYRQVRALPDVKMCL
ncbi:DUF493 family protein YbeD [Pleionea sediminis]|uniref:DUF493 family protein YbeD n=1 Tax=Pleionea sediminis TaxID=2569479 RepID=UPI001186AA71|nr:DUF493 family protein YbeD [Pleionea sediminis]